MTVAVQPLDRDGYPLEWHTVKRVVRASDGHRCVRCRHPYFEGEHGSGEWSPCDSLCTHRGPVRLWLPESAVWVEHQDVCPETYPTHLSVEARWRILTVHHLDGVKTNLHWWNLASLCQRCHLTIQGKVQMERIYLLEHSDWFKPYAAGYYAWVYLNELLTREEVALRQDELLALERVV